VHHELDRLRATEPNVRVVFRDFIPAYDPAADEAARLARCAAQQGRFEAVRQALLARDPPGFGTPWLTADARSELARSAGMDLDALNACLRSRETGAAIVADSNEAQTLGFDEPPAVVAEGIPLSGMQSADGLRSALAQAASRR
jgi:protein-disulfide isomerase